jgi:hypothetical protein
MNAHDVTRKFRVEIQGRGAVTLGPDDHVATGGEAAVYRVGEARGGRGGKGSLAVKIWLDPEKALRDRMAQKLAMLSRLAHPFVVAPGALAVGAAGEILGFAMPWIEDSWAMPLAFTNDWRAANAFGDRDALAFASRMREAVLFVHAEDVAMGDANELNVLGVGREPRFIDVDAWSVPGFPGDKIMPTVRDWHAAPFSRDADWFAWAVTTFQLLVGVHPYRGTHPGFARNDLEGRMKARASVFASGVRLPPAVRPMQAVPSALLDWYRAVFEDGHRRAPPDPAALSARAVARHAPAAVQDGALTATHLFALPSPVARLAAPGLVLLEDGQVLSLTDGRSYGRADPSAALVRRGDGAVLAAVARNGEVLHASVRPGVPGRYVASGIAASSVWSSGNRLFAVARDGILELLPRDVASGSVLLAGRKWALSPDATAFGDGMAVYDALGAKHVVVPDAGTGVAMLRARDLDGLVPLAMVMRGRVGRMSLMDSRGGYRRATLLLSEDRRSCAVTLSDADHGSLTDAVTANGIAVRIDEQGMLEASVPATGALRVANPGPAAGGRLIASAAGVLCALPDRVLALALS